MLIEEQEIKRNIQPEEEESNKKQNQYNYYTYKM